MRISRDHFRAILLFVLPRVLFVAVTFSFAATLFAEPRAIQIPFTFESSTNGTFIAHAPSAVLALTRDGVALEIQSGQKRSALEIHFAGANSAATLRAADPLPGRANYFIGRDPSRWRTNVQLYGRVVYHDLYPGIDLQFHGDPKHLEYDWILAAGADPGLIRMSFEGAESVRIDRSGDLVISLPETEIRQQKPNIFQNGRRLQGRFVRHGANAAGFELKGYDKTLPLTIDPILTYSTYLGGQDGDAIYAAGEDSQGNLIVGGATLSPNFPTRNPVVIPISGNVQGFIAKINPAAPGGASLVWSTYIGGGDNFSWVLGVAADAQGNVLATGTTAATGFPLVNPYQNVLNRVAGSNGCPNTPFDLNAKQTCTDAFVVKLNPAGNQIVYSTYLGGNINEAGYAIASDAAGNAYVTGQTSSFDFPAPGSPYQTTLKGPSDAFLTRFGPDGTLNYSTYFGGDADDIATSMAVTPKGSVYLAGATSSSSLPLVNPFQNARPAPVVGFVARIDLINSGPGTLGYSTYLGGVSGSASITSMALGPNGNVYLAGGTDASDFPITTNAVKTQYTFSVKTTTPVFDIPSFVIPTFLGSAVNGDAFLTELNPAAVSTAQIIYSTFLGGIYNDAATGVALDSTGRVLISGVTSSYDFPVTGDAFIGNNGSATVVPTLKAFLAIVDTTLSGPAGIAYATYLGGSANDFSTKLAVDSAGTAAILVGQTRSRNFPVDVPYQAQFGGQITAGILQGDGFITRFDLTQNSPIINSATNGASFQLGAGFAPGEIVTFKGVRLGPAQIILAQLASNGRLATQLGECEVLIDGIAAPLVHSLATQITAILPYELAAKIGQSVNAQVVCGGLPSNLYPLPIVDSNPGIFSVSGGTGQAALLNQDGSYNNSANPASLGTIVQIFATGEGVLTPPGVDGQLETGPLASIPKPVLPIRVFFAGVASFDVPYVGVAPGEVDGLLQIDVRVPTDAPTGNVELLLQVGENTSPSKLTIALK